jgi:predicted glycoside hydrolase/deacetylase ChbG (UPF0249 family)
MKRIILCADDFGQSAAISRGILQLVQAGRLSAVSCMTEADAWQESGPGLAQQRDSIDIGLHFNLTHACGVQHFRARPLNSILIDSLCGRLDQRALAIALHAQLDRFEAVIGKAPDFIDGHQHVHVLPGVRGVLLREISRRYPGHKPYLRNVNPYLQHSPAPLKTMLLKSLNVGFLSAAHRAGLTCTRGFGGIYSLRPDADFAALMQGWLAMAQSGDLLMCHPGAATVDASDPIAATRPRELQHLGSDDFAAQMRSAGVQLSRFIRSA